MDNNLQSKIEKHQQALTQYMRELAHECNNSLGNKMEYQAIIDAEGNHFQLVKIGWRGQRHIYNVLIHFDIHPQTGNIWVQQNNTEILLDEELAKFNITKKDLVLGFRYPAIREVLDFAVA